MKQEPASAIATVAIGKAAEHLDRTYTSFQRCAGLPLHVFVIGARLPERQWPGIHYHRVDSVPDFSHPLREIYFRRLELIDELGVDQVLVVDVYDVLCLQPLPAFASLLGEAAVAGCVEHAGNQYLEGQQYTSSFLNGGVMFWNVPESREMRREIINRGRTRFRNVVDDQLCLNEVVQTRYYDRLRLLPCQYNYRAYLAPKSRIGWPQVGHLDGVILYHNSDCIEVAKALGPVKPRADLPPLSADPGPLNARQQLLRRLQTRWKSRKLV